MLQINGLYRHGFMISPAILDAALELFAHGESPLAQQLNIKIEHA
jgi:glycine oxidase